MERRSSLLRSSECPNANTGRANGHWVAHGDSPAVPLIPSGFSIFPRGGDLATRMQVKGQRILEFTRFGMRGRIGGFHEFDVQPAR